MKNRTPCILLFYLFCFVCTPLVLGQTTEESKSADSEVNDAPEKGADRKPQLPRLKRLKNGHYQVTQLWMLNLNGETWRIEEGYRSNGITAPNRIKRALGDGVDEPLTWAAVFHDWLFTQPNISRKKADRLFYELMIVYKIPKDKIQLMYNTVRIYSITKRFR